jgi:PqqD family protein of HPr-rel-A system
MGEPADLTAGWAQRIDCKRTSVPPRRRDVSEHPAEGGTLLFAARDGKTLLLNETAALVWRACESETTLAELTRQLAEKYDVDSETAADHVEQLVTLFAESGLLMLEAAQT